MAANRRLSMTGRNCKPAKRRLLQLRRLLQSRRLARRGGARRGVTRRAARPLHGDRYRALDGVRYTTVNGGQTARNGRSLPGAPQRPLHSVR